MKYQKIFGYDSMLEDLLKTIQQKRALKVSFDTGSTKENTGSLAALELKILG